MLRQATLDKLHQMRLSVMAHELERQLTSPEVAELAFEDRFGLIVDAEWSHREHRKLDRRLKGATLRYDASVEDINYKAARGLDRQVVLALASGDWLRSKRNLLIVGPTGIGKSFLSCAFVEKACRLGFSGQYVRAPRLLDQLHVARGDGSYSRLLSRLAKLDLLAIDDWLLHPVKDAERRDLLEVIEDRYQRSSTLIASQLPVGKWHEALGEPTLADAICDRLVHSAYRLELDGRSMREPPKK